MISTFVKAVSISMELRYYEANLSIKLPRILEMKNISYDRKNGSVAS